MVDVAAAGLVLTGEDKRIVGMVHDFVMKEVRPRAAKHDISGELDWDAYNKTFEIGLVCADLLAEYGGQGLSNVTAAWIRGELMYGDAGFGLTCGTNNLGIKPVFLAGTEEQKKWCVDIFTGGRPGGDPRWPQKRSSFAAFALTEPDAGPDAGACKTLAQKVLDGDGSVKEYILSGRKYFIANACYADFMCIVASVDRSLRYKKLTMSLVGVHLPGVSIGKHKNKMGIRQSATCDAIFENVYIPVSALISKEGEGFKIAMKTLEQGRAGVGSGYVGIMKAAKDVYVKYVRERVSMGKPIYKNQAIGFKIADMEIAIETSRAIGMKVAAPLDAGDPSAATLSPIAKCYCSDTLNHVVTEAVQILGGYGYMRDYPVEELMRDAKIFQISGGTNEIQRVVINGNVVCANRIR